MLIFLPLPICLYLLHFTYTQTQDSKRKLKIWRIDNGSSTTYEGQVTNWPPLNGTEKATAAERKQKSVKKQQIDNWIKILNDKMKAIESERDNNTFTQERGKTQHQQIDIDTSSDASQSPSLLTTAATGTDITTTTAADNLDTLSTLPSSSSSSSILSPISKDDNTTMDIDAPSFDLSPTMELVDVHDNDSPNDDDDFNLQFVRDAESQHAIFCEAFFAKPDNRFSQKEMYYIKVVNSFLYLVLNIKSGSYTIKVLFFVYN